MTVALLFGEDAGEISHDAVSLDVDKMFDLNNGVAIVSKGTSSALINSKGVLCAFQYVRFRVLYRNCVTQCAAQ